MPVSAPGTDLWLQVTSLPRGSEVLIVGDYDSRDMVRITETGFGAGARRFEC